MTRARAGTAVAILIALGAAFQALPAQAERRLRSDFYGNTPFGSLAWVKNSKTRSAARSNLAVIDLTEETCINLPTQGIQWFMINHSDADLEGRAGYFSVRILYDFGSEDRSSEDQIGIHLQRNGNWFDASGNTTPDEYELNPDQITLSGQSFINLHDPSEDGNQERLKGLEQAVGNWHMKPTRDAKSTWEDRYLYGPTLRAYLGQSDLAISARLMRFTATASTWSTKPVVFWLDPRGAKAATILVNAPRHPDTPSRRVYAVKFGGTCP